MGKKARAVLAVAAAVLTAGAADAPLSAAQIALFESGHLEGIERPTVLEYSFVHRGAGGDYDDEITADVRVVHPDGRKDVWVNFLSGERHVDFPPAMSFHGNPVLMFFLEHDVMEMHRITGGAAQYFRNRIRQAFVDRAAMHPTEVTIDGAPHPATEIAIEPFRNDANAARFPAFAAKTYHFVLSDAVAGTIYQIRTTSDDGNGLAETYGETMTYAGKRESTP